MSFIKNITPKSEIEPWIYTTFKHPNLLPVEIKRNKYHTTLIMPQGKILDIHISEKDFEKLFSSLMNIIIFMYRNGLIYGDIKLENMILLENNFHLIDMDLVYFYNLGYELNTQTFQPLKGKDNPLRRMIYALGYLVYRWKKQLNICRLSDYIQSLSKPLELDKFDKWTPFIIEAMQNDQATLQDIIILVPISIGTIEGIANYSPTPEYPEMWDDTLDKHNRFFYDISRMFKSDNFFFCLSMEIYWRYFKLVQKEKNISNHFDYDDIAKCIFFSSFKLVCSLKNIGIGIGPLAFHGLVNIDLLKSVEQEFMKTLGYRLPSLFRDGYISGTVVSDEIEGIIYQLGNPTNILELRKNVKNKILTPSIIKLISDSSHKSYISVK